MVKILIPYASAHVIYYVSKRLTGTIFSKKEIFWGILGKGYIVDFSWYPIVIILLYVLFDVIWKLKLEEYQKVILIILGNIGITFGLYWVFKGLEWWYFSTMSFSTGILLYFLVHITKLNSMILLFAGLLTAIGGDVFMIPVCHRIFGSGVQIVYYILAHNVARTGMAIALISAISSVYRRRSHVIRKLAGITYEIYLMHGMILYILIKLKVYYFPWIFVLLTFAASILLAWITHFINRKLIHTIQYYRLGA